MSQSNVNFRMDTELKKNMEETCKLLGLNMTTAFTIFATKMCREKRIPFEVCADPFYSENNQRHLMQSISQLEEGKGQVHDLIEVSDND